MQHSSDVAVVGLGAMGSLTVHALAARGHRVLGLDQFRPPHALGSTHGQTRIIREAYYEHPLYVPLVRRAYDRWAALERETGERLFVQTGGLMIGAGDGALVAGARASATAHDIAHELLDPQAVRRRFPAYTPAPGMVALLEHRAGVLFPERIVAAALARAAHHGAELRLGERVVAWEEHGAGVRVTTDAGHHDAARVVLAVGPWVVKMLPGVAAPLTVERQLFHWFTPTEPGAFAPARCPIALVEYAPDRLFACFPDVGGGVKVGVHHEGTLVDPDHVDRAVTAEEDAGVRALVDRFLPAAGGPIADRAVCLYTNTPDHDFFIDTHPLSARVIVASPCSGHGFKFASAIGEILADLATLGGTTTFDIGPFRRR